LGAVILPSRKPHNVRTPRTDPAGAPGRHVIVQLPSDSVEARLATHPTGGSRRNACSSGCSSAPQSLAPFLGAILLTVGAGHN